MITEREWDSILEAIAARIPQSEIMVAKVIDRDEVRRVIFIQEFRGTPIPIVGFRGIVKYYDEAVDEYEFLVPVTRLKTAIFDIEVPRIGDSVVILKGRGSSGIARCIGVILSTHYESDT